MKKYIRCIAQAGARCFDTCFLTCEIYSVTCLKFDQKALAHPRSLEGGPCKRKVDRVSARCLLGPREVDRPLGEKSKDASWIARVSRVYTGLSQHLQGFGRPTGAAGARVRPPVSRVCLVTTLTRIWPAHGRGRSAGAPPWRKTAHTVATQ